MLAVEDLENNYHMVGAPAPGIEGRHKRLHLEMVYVVVEDFKGETLSSLYRRCDLWTLY